jgi:glycosyltransferase involved in cell wall biosynthesis
MLADPQLRTTSNTSEATLGTKYMDLSIVIPVYNEVGNIVPLYDRLTEVLRSIGKPYEMIFIDDGSTDDTVKALEGLHDPLVKVVRFQRNFGKAAALSCGFSRSTGKIVITMDGDLQDDPREIPRFIQALETFEVVSGWKQKRNDPLSKVIPSRIFNAMTRAVTGIKLHDFNCGFKGYRHYVVKNMSLYGEMHRYIPAIAHLKGYTVGEIAVEHHPRVNGKSKYGAKRLFSGFLDLITIKFLMSYAKRPMHIFGSLGLGSGAIGVITCLYLLVQWTEGVHIGNRPLLTLGVLLIIIGIQFMAIGLIGELIVNSRNNNDWIIRKV